MSVAEKIEIKLKFFGKKNFAGKEKSFAYTSSTLRRDFVDKFFAMCRWALWQKNVFVICCFTHSGKSMYVSIILGIKSVRWGKGGKQIISAA